ncbi:MAG: hypothetical protein IPG57_09805 [Burkholderiales bacterium]|nr:hypothetical protein [Burkholderiales bacterium]
MDLQTLRIAVARTAPLEDLHGCIDALVIGRLAASTLPSRLLSDYYGTVGLPPGDRSYQTRMQALFETAPSGSALGGMAFGAPEFAGDLRQRLLPLLHWTLRLLSLVEPWWQIAELNTPWGGAALDVLSDELADLLSVQPSRHFGAWPGAGLGVRRFNAATHVPEFMYGAWDLQFDDDDATAKYAGSVRAGGGKGHVEALVNDLRALGFTAPAAGTTRFDARVAMAVREFQIEAAEERLSLDAAGVQHAQRVRSPRRYFGRVHGIVDGETRRLLQLWLNLPNVEGDLGPLGPPGTQAHNALLVVACESTAPNQPVAASVVSDDIWGPLAIPLPSGVDSFDFQTEGRRHWTIDWLKRWGEPVAAEAPVLASFGPPVPAADVDATPLGRYQRKGGENYDLGGPAMLNSDHWRSTLQTLARFQELPSVVGAAERRQDWLVLFGITARDLGRLRTW